jgi:hypothetical protein
MDVKKIKKEIKKQRKKTANMEDDKTLTVDNISTENTTHN